jgi:hypothetical protein
MATPSASRRLTTHQQAVLVQVLSAFPGQRAEIRYSSGTPDAFAYAQDFLTIFKAVGWLIDDAESVTTGAAHNASLAFLVQDHNLPASCEALRDALRIYGIEVETLPDAATAAPGSLVLSVGAGA